MDYRTGPGLMHPLIDELSAMISLDFRASIGILIIVLNFIWTGQHLVMASMTPPMNHSADCGETRCECGTDRQGARTRAGAQVQALQTHRGHPLLFHQRMEHGHIMINLSTKGDLTPVHLNAIYRCLFREDQRPTSPESDHSPLTMDGGSL